MSVLKTYNLSLDMYDQTSNKKFEVVEGDTGNVILITLTDRGSPVDLSDCRVLIVFTKGTQPVEQDNDGNGVTIIGDDHNVIRLELYVTSYRSGENSAEVQVFSEGDTAGVYDKLVTSAWFNFTARRARANDETLQATKEWPLLQTALNRLADIERGVQADYTESDAAEPDYIKNKPGSMESLGSWAASHASRHGPGGSDPVTPIAHAARHASAGVDAISPSDILAAGKSTLVTATLSASGWSGTSYALVVAGVTANSAVEVLPGLNITQDQLDALQAANLQDGGQSAGSITLKAFGDVPTIDLPVRIIVRGDLY